MSTLRRWADCRESSQGAGALECGRRFQIHTCVGQPPKQAEKYLLAGGECAPLSAAKPARNRAQLRACGTAAKHRVLIVDPNHLL